MLFEKSLIKRWADRRQVPPLCKKHPVTGKLRGVGLTFAARKIQANWFAPKPKSKRVRFGAEQRLAGERMRLGVSVEQIEDEKIEDFQQNGNDVCLIAKAFDILARREFTAYNEFYSKIE